MAKAQNPVLDVLKQIVTGTVVVAAVIDLSSELVEELHAPGSRLSPEHIAAVTTAACGMYNSDLVGIAARNIGDALDLEVVHAELTAIFDTNPGWQEGISEGYEPEFWSAEHAEDMFLSAHRNWGGASS